MKTVLIFSATTGYQLRAFADAARKLGVDLLYATNRCKGMDDPWGDHSIPVKFESPEKSLEFLRRADVQPDAIVAVGDRPTHIAAIAAREFGLPYNSIDSVEASRNKFLARERFASAGLRLPRYFLLKIDDTPEFAAASAPYPCVLKPLGLSASRGVIRADNPGEFAAAFQRIRDLLKSPDLRRHREAHDDYIQVESFIPGREFALEGIVTGGRLRTLALFDKPDPLDGPFFEETIYLTPSSEPAAVQEALRDTAQQAVSALGLSRGPVHIELRYNDDGPWILEVAARPIGGLCSRVLRFEGGISLEELILRHALGEDVSGLRLDQSAAGVMMIPVPLHGVYHAVDGVEAAKAVPLVEELLVTAKEGQEVVPLPEGSTYMGFIFARGETPRAVDQALREAHALLRFEIMPALPTIHPRAGVFG